ncbi:MAG: tetratricopeptide repeat protein [Promethearchaeota archaeon]
MSDKSDEEIPRLNTIYPPDDILNPKIKNTNYEYVILWMLANNNHVTWSDFKREISESTLSGKINDLIEEESIERFKKGYYKITPKGLSKFNELLVTGGSGERYMSYPPQAITRGRNYSHVILWMLYHNGSCSWSDFQADPLNINNSSLSKHKKRLVEKGYIDQSIDKEYYLTSDGKSAYFKILRLYDLDRQSILDEESHRLEEITRITNDFFEKYEVSDSKIKFRFLNYILKLNYQKVENLLSNEEDFNKIILFLAYNHPDSSPNYISIDMFSNKYQIKQTILEFFLEKIVEEELYAVKFHKLEVIPDKEYYFQANGKLERVLRAIVDDKITKFTYLNKLQETSAEGAPFIKIDVIFEEIINEICVNLFYEELKPSLKSFLPEYIKYLAYKIESETKLTNTDAKLESIVIQAAMEDLKTYNVTPIITESGQTEYTYRLDQRLFETLDGFYIDKLMLLKDQDFAQKYNLTGIRYYHEIIKGLKKGTEYQKLKKLVNSISDDLSDLQKLILDDILFTYHYEFENSLKTSEKIIDTYPDQPVGFLFHSLTNQVMGDYNEALESLKDTEGISHQIWLICQKAQVLSKKNKYDTANKILDAALEKDPGNLFLIRTKILVNFSNEECYDQKPELFFDLVDNGLEINPNSIDLKILKVALLCVNEKYKDAKRYLDKELSMYYYNEDYSSVGTSCLFLRAYTYTARGKFEKALKDAEKSMVHYEDHYTAFSTKALVLGYNLIFNFELDQINKEEFVEIIDKAITVAPNKGSQSRFLSFKACVFNEMGDTKEALKAINNALELAPEAISLYHQKVFILYSSNKAPEAMDLIDYIIEQFDEGTFKMMQMKSIIYYQNRDFKNALKVNDDTIRRFPKDQYRSQYPSILNNRAVLFAELGQTDEAIETAKEMIELNKNDGNQRDSFGEILLISGDYKEAIKQFKEAIALNPKGWYINQSYIKMGLCYMKLKDYERAKENFEIGKELWDKKPPKERRKSDYNPNAYLMELEEIMKKL